jgi:uncharacterized repeat protein (TIGR03806 family)
MRAQVLFLGLILVSAIPLACGDTAVDSSSGGTSSGSSSGSSGASTSSGGSSGMVDPPVMPAPYGLDARPKNLTCIPKKRPELNTGAKVASAFAGAKFQQPIDMRTAPGDAANVYVAERGGVIYEVSRATGAKREFFRVPNGTINADGEGGFLGFSFHPKWNTGTQELFASYTRFGGASAANMRSVVARFKSADGGKTVSFATEDEVFTVDQPFSNHNGGNLAFGPDGLLYFGLGDGGSGGDPLRSGQDKNSFLGKFLRFDVSGAEGGKKYKIPASNPFAKGGGKPEIFAYGVRNPWRWSFDKENGDLWAGDVGQGAWEEIDIIRLGGNYGWNTREGRHCYNAANCDSRGMIDPIAEHDRNDAKSITGGYVYRGKTLPGLVGKFIYGDFSTGNIWAVEDEGGGKGTPQLLANVPGNNLASFGQDQDGEVYTLSLQQGTIGKIVATAPAPASDFPDMLSKTGCVAPGDASKPAEGLIPYAPIAPFWSDGADKERFFALPEGGTIKVGADGDWDFPNGTVLVKDFSIAGKRIETRLFMRHDDGVWAGYSYEWNDAQTDATLLPGSKAKAVGNQTWQYPSRNQCMQCHTQAAGFSLGLESSQLNYEFVYRAQGRKSNQLATLSKIGVLASPIGDVATLPVYPAYTDESKPLEARARAYLHSNCSNCHRPQGGGRGNMDLQFSVPLSGSKVCEAATLDNLGISGAKIVSPGKPEDSIMSKRMRTLDVNRMPQLSSVVVDDKGATLIDSWIKGMTTCP